MIQKETGWTDEYLLWEISWSNVQMKLKDAPYYQYRSSGKKGEKVVSQKELVEYLNNQIAN